MPLLPPSAPAGLPQPLGYGFQQQRQQLGQLQLQSQPAQAQRLPQQALLPQAAGQGASLGRRLPLEAAGIDASELAAGVACRPDQSVGTPVECSARARQRQALRRFAGMLAVLLSQPPEQPAGQAWTVYKGCRTSPLSSSCIPCMALLAPSAPFAPAHLRYLPFTRLPPAVPLAADAAVVACLQAAAEAALVVQMARAKLAQHAPHAAAATGAAQPAAGAAAAAGAGVAIRGLATGPPSETEAAAGRPQLRPRRGGAAVKLEDLDLLEDAAGAELEAAEPAGAKRKR